MYLRECVWAPSTTIGYGSMWTHTPRLFSHQGNSGGWRVCRLEGPRTRHGVSDSTNLRRILGHTRTNSSLGTATTSPYRPHCHRGDKRSKQRRKRRRKIHHGETSIFFFLLSFFQTDIAADTRSPRALEAIHRKDPGHGSVVTCPVPMEESCPGSPGRGSPSRAPILL